MGLGLGLLGTTLGAEGQGLPSDVRSNHWAGKAVQQVLSNGVMSLQPDKKFHGEAKVTHAQAAVAIANLARALEAGKWQTKASVVVPEKVITTLQSGDWKQQKLTRYSFSVILARLGNYIGNGMVRAATGSKEVAKSEAIPAKITVPLPASNPAYVSLTYLANNRMVRAGSPLLKADDKPILGEEVSLALAEMTTGLTDRVTEMGRDEQGDRKSVV